MQPGAPLRRVDARWVLTALAVGLVVFRIFWPDLLDETALLILAVGALPWLGSFVRSFKAFGMEAELREIKETAAEAKAVARDAAQQVDLERPLAPAAPDVAMATAGAVDGLFQLADRYVATRGSMQSGSTRTAEMTRIFREMMAEARRTGPNQPQALAGLDPTVPDADPGKQLAAVAYVYEMPDQVDPGRLIACIAGSRQPFVQYWGLMALRKHAKLFGPSRFSAADMAGLAALRGAFRKGTDRAWVYDQILAELDRPQTPEQGA